MYLELARRNLSRAKIRSALAVIGILIGVMAIASIGIFGESLKATVMKNFQDLANELIITPAYSQGYTSIDERTVSKLRKIPYAESIIPIKRYTEFLDYRGRKIPVTIYGIDYVEELFEIEKGSVRRGEAVAGSKIAERLNLRVGSKIVIKGEEFRISGILKEEGARFDINPNNAILVSVEDFGKLKEAEYSMVIVKVERLEEIEAFKKSVDRIVNSREEKVSVFELKMIIERIEQIFGQMTLFLMAIAAVSLFVAGVSILNIMLMSTIERTKEIGVMRAIGAYRGTILRIFLTEALILGIAGSIIGGVLSLAGGYAIDMLVLGSAEYLFQASSLMYIVEGILFGIATAIISAAYPAWKASRLEPIEALRYE